MNRQRSKSSEVVFRQEAKIAEFKLAVLTGADGQEIDEIRRDLHDLYDLTLDILTDSIRESMP